MRFCRFETCGLRSVKYDCHNMFRIAQGSERREEQHPLDVIDDGRRVGAYVAELQKKLRAALPAGDLSRVELFSFGGADGGGGIVAWVQGEHVSDVMRIMNDPRVSVLPLTCDEYVRAIENEVCRREPKAKVEVLEVGENRRTRIAVPAALVRDVQNRLPTVGVAAVA